MIAKCTSSIRPYKLQCNLRLPGLDSRHDFCNTVPAITAGTVLSSTLIELSSADDHLALNCLLLLVSTSIDIFLYNSFRNRFL